MQITCFLCVSSYLVRGYLEKNRNVILLPHIYSHRQQGRDTLAMAGDHSHSAAEGGCQWYLLAAVNSDTTSPSSYSSLGEEVRASKYMEAAAAAVSGNVCSVLLQLFFVKCSHLTHLAPLVPFLRLPPPLAFPFQPQPPCPERTNSSPPVPGLTLPGYFSRAQTPRRHLIQTSPSPSTTTYFPHVLGRNFPRFCLSLYPWNPVCHDYLAPVNLNRQSYVPLTCPTSFTRTYRDL